MDMIIMMNIGVIGMIAFFMFTGFTQGFVLKLISILSFFVLGFLAWQLSSPISNWISLYPAGALPIHDELIAPILYDSLNRMCVFVILFVVFVIALTILRPAARMLNHIPVVSIINRVAGSMLGAVQAILLLFVIAMFIRLPLWQNGEEIVDNSYLRYSDPLTKTVLFYIKEPMMELNKIQDVASDTRKLTKEEANRLSEWLLQQNIDKENAQRLLDMLQVE